ncbi:MAG: hypothetical protein GF334_09670, partial [Candidatus Altiarchaeales archaeon]|nr:hypothetical protein [Candidatus Altiarchaeales archaeon]
MNEHQKAATLLDVDAEELSFFSVGDPFNPPNTIEGFLCKRSDHRYGALVLFQVNGQEVPPEVIYGTPKQRYPFKMRRGERNYLWPKDIKAIKAYEKLDGTNILAYSYQDAEGNRFITFKTRLTPVVRNGLHASHKDLWKNLLEDRQDISEAAQQASESLSLAFEMYGNMNPLLISYDTPLEAVVIFGVSRKDASVIIPEDLRGVPETARAKPTATLEGTDNFGTLSSFFEKRQRQSEE